MAIPPGPHQTEPVTPFEALTVTPALRPAAVELLLGRGGRVPPEAVERFCRQAPDLGIDLELMAATRHTTAPDTPTQVCLPVPGAGGTVMLFVAGLPSGGARPGQDHTERAAAIRHAVRTASERRTVKLVQALLEPRETASAPGYEEAGMSRLAELLYLARPLKLQESVKHLVSADGVRRPDGGAWPAGITVRPLGPEDTDERMQRTALLASYERTLDCPELAGLRDIDDIVAAHRAVGEYDPAMWWLVERSGKPEGCVLLNRCSLQGCVELVYIGLSPAVRGLGLGDALMRCAIGVSAGLERELRCAVDSRNTPARRLYDRLGFRDAGRRIAFVGLAGDIV